MGWLAAEIGQGRFALTGAAAVHPDTDIIDGDAFPSTCGGPPEVVLAIGLDPEAEEHIARILRTGLIPRKGVEYRAPLIV